MPKFRKKPIVIEAVKITSPVIVKTLEGDMKGKVGDWLITGVGNEQYICKDSTFLATYDPIDDESKEYIDEHSYGFVSADSFFGLKFDDEV